ncbi:8442_t:CDS:1, partial [Cetraspora pellucida]
DLTEDMVTGDTIIKWYSYTNRAASEDYIRATSNYYNEPSFSDVSISVDESEEFRTDNGTCFCK